MKELRHAYNISAATYIPVRIQDAINKQHCSYCWIRHQQSNPSNNFVDFYTSQMGHLNLSQIQITGRPGRRVQFHIHIQAVQVSIPDQDAVYPDYDYRGMAQSMQPNTTTSGLP